MKRLLVSLAILGLAAVACARHVVVERNLGRVDSTRSILSDSDLQWTVKHEPAPAVVADPQAAPDDTVGR